jgi:hypothetical protein
MLGFTAAGGPHKAHVSALHKNEEVSSTTLKSHFLFMPNGTCICPGNFG